MSNIEFSVVMSVYRNDKPEFVRSAVESISILQTIKPTEIILVIDGPIHQELKNTIDDLINKIPYIHKISLPENKGLGNALKIGVLEASNEIIMRMDSDDVALPNRFEKQLKYIDENPDVAVVGGQIIEFIGDESNKVAKREVPCSVSDVKKMIGRRCPMNHVTVALARSKVLEAGNYQDWFWNEDYWLWIRMCEKGMKLANIPDVLVNVRVGKEMYARRGSLKYFKSEEKLQRYMLKKGMINIFQYIFNVGTRFGVQVLMPNNVRSFVFRKFLRS